MVTTSYIPVTRRVLRWLLLRWRVGIALLMLWIRCRRARLVAAPGVLRDVELEVLGWRTEHGEPMLPDRPPHDHQPQILHSVVIHPRA